MFCSKCGNEVPDDSIFCPKCGKKIGAISATTEIRRWKRVYVKALTMIALLICGGVIFYLFYFQKTTSHSQNEVSEKEYVNQGTVTVSANNVGEKKDTFDKNPNTSKDEEHIDYQGEAFLHTVDYKGEAIPEIIAYYNGNGELVYYKRYTFDWKMRLGGAYCTYISLDLCSPMGDILDHIDYSEDTIELSYMPDHIDYDNYKIIRYNETIHTDGDLYETRGYVYEDGWYLGGISKYKYDEMGNRYFLMSYSYDKNGNITYTQKYTYDEKMNLIEQKEEGKKTFKVYKNAGIDKEGNVVWDIFENGEQKGQQTVSRESFEEEAIPDLDGYYRMVIYYSSEKDAKKPIVKDYYKKTKKGELMYQELLSPSASQPSKSYTYYEDDKKVRYEQNKEIDGLAIELYFYDVGDDFVPPMEAGKYQ